MLSEPQSIPALRSGSNELTPGDWSTRVKDLPWISAKEGRYVKSELIKSIAHMAPRREPVLRYGITWTGEMLNHYLSQCLRRVEAIYMFTVGTVASNECQDCERERRVFPFCVVVDLPNGHVGCANCYWDGRSCSNSPATPTIAPTNPSAPQPVIRQLEMIRQAITSMRRAQAAHGAQIASIQSAKRAVFDRIERRRLPLEGDARALDEAVDGRRGAPSLDESFANLSTELDKIVDAFAALNSCYESARR